MNEQVRFFPNSEEFKKPYGALRAGEPLTLNLKFNRPSNPSEVFLVLTKDGESDVYYPMNFVTVEPDSMTEYTVTVTVTTKGLYFYHFIVNTEDKQYRIGCGDDLHAMLGKGHDWQLTVFEEVYKAPEFLKGGLIYQIMPDRFFDGGARRKTKPYARYRDDWNGLPEYEPDAEGRIRNEDFFGGNLRGIIKKLGYLKSLGVTCIYLNPIFEAHSNHKYDTGNYRKVDSDFGTTDDLKELIKKADKKGMKIILDGVFSHTGDDSIYFNKYGRYDSVGAYQSVHSPYYKWYEFKNYPDEYDCWWNIDILPQTRECEPSFSEYICGEDGIIRYWTEFGIGGWRLDVADELPDCFLDRAVHAAKAVNPDCIVLGEVWEDASNKISYSKRRRYLNGGQLDSVTNYPFKEDILNFVRCGDAEKLNNTVNVILNDYPSFVVNNLMNLLDTHDTARLKSVLGDSGDTSTRQKRALAKISDPEHTLKLMKIAATLQYTLPGVPCLYYGDEAGLEGFEDPFNRRCYPWEQVDRNCLKMYKKLGAVRSSEKAILAEGKYAPVSFENGVFAFRRIGEEGELVIIANRSDKPFAFHPDENYTELTSFKPFGGTVEPFDAVILKKTSDVVFPEKKTKK